MHSLKSHKSFQELSDLVARTGGDVPNAPPYRHNKAEADNNESFLTFVLAIVIYFKSLNKGFTISLSNYMGQRTPMEQSTSGTLADFAQQRAYQPQHLGQYWLSCTQTVEGANQQHTFALLECVH